MAIRAKLTSQFTTPQRDWPYHALESTVVSASVFMAGERRMEAETYLATGYGLRQAIESQHGWTRFGSIANVRQPSRLKGIQLPPIHGVPYLAATQVFDVRPIPRKWLSPDRTKNLDGLLVQRGTILVTRSGSVGRATLAFQPHLNVLISDDLLRVEPHDPKWFGWIYAYLRAVKTRAMMTSAKYGHIIKHLETGHLEAVPIPILRDRLLEEFNPRVQEILKLRDEAHASTLQAESHFAGWMGDFEIADIGENGFESRSAEFCSRNRRLDAQRHNPVAKAISEHLRYHAKAINPLAQCGFSVWVPGRYKRVPARDGVAFVDSGELFEINPDMDKRYADCQFGDRRYRGRVQPGWLLMASSGQTYGQVGGVVMASEAHVGKVLANHIIRIVANDSATARPGYVLTALSHPTFGRPRIKSLAFGSSVPEISPDDIAMLDLPRLDANDENGIADLAEQSATLRGKADILENDLATDAEAIIDRFIAGDTNMTLPAVSENRVPNHATPGGWRDLTSQPN